MLKELLQEFDLTQKNHVFMVLGCDSDVEIGGP